MNKRKNLDRQKRKRQNLILALMLAVIALALLGRFLIGRDQELNPEELTPVTNSSESLPTTAPVATSIAADSFLWTRRCGMKMILDSNF